MGRKTCVMIKVFLPAATSFLNNISISAGCLSDTFSNKEPE